MFSEIINCIVNSAKINASIYNKFELKKVTNRAPKLCEVNSKFNCKKIYVKITHIKDSWTFSIKFIKGQ